MHDSGTTSILSLQATLDSMQQGRNDESWKGRLQRLRAELEAAKAERDGLKQLLQQARGPYGGPNLQQPAPYDQIHGSGILGQQQQQQQGGRSQIASRGPMPALRGPR